MPKNLTRYVFRFLRNKIPPERLKNKSKHDIKGDIYSLGVILWEISAEGRTPFPESDYLTVYHICQGAREAPMDGTPNAYVNIYTECWDGDPEKRPCLAEVLRRL